VKGKFRVQIARGKINASLDREADIRERAGCHRFTRFTRFSPEKPTHIAYRSARTQEKEKEGGGTSTTKYNSRTGSASLDSDHENCKVVINFVIPESLVLLDIEYSKSSSVFDRYNKIPRCFATISSNN